MKIDSSLPVLRVIWGGTEHSVSYVPGRSVRDILDSTEMRVVSACGGVGACGRCLVALEEGEANPVTAAESVHLSIDEIRQGLRLACQLIPQGNVCIHVRCPAPISSWKTPQDDDFTPALITLDPTAGLYPGQGYGVAIDVGTTHLRVTVWDLVIGRRLASRTGPNPQAAFGADVLMRLATARESVEKTEQLSQLLRNALGDALRDIFNREFEDAEAAKKQITELLVVGNPPMLALLSARNVSALLEPENWTRKIDYQPEDTASWRRCWGITAECHIELVPPLAGFVGADLLAGVVATGLTEACGGALLIDVGTNIEVALWDGQQLWVTSTPGGPAFEGSGLSCGLPAETGAIAKAWLTSPDQELAVDVIGGGSAKGVCGSGLVDIVACLRRTGIVNSGGRFINTAPGQAFLVSEQENNIQIKAGDIDALQRAKAGLAAATVYLLQQAGMVPNDLQRICVSGAFGSYLDVVNAQSIGLLPEVLPERVELYTNTALAGCEQLLFLPERTVLLEQITAESKLINMSLASEFEELFINNLWLRPIQMPKKQSVTNLLR